MQPAPCLPDTGTLNFQWSQILIAGLVAAGVKRAVISPGSRSTPLALALLRQPGITCDVVIDERCAAFFALGAARASQTPVLVVATSGTAVANWLPAVSEANLAGVPLILLSADRPAELYGVGANQTMPQAGLFGPQVRACHTLSAPTAGFDPRYLLALAKRSVEQALWPHPGPVHINQPFHEPLLPTGDTALPARHDIGPVLRPATPPAPQQIEELAAALSGQPGLIVCGELPPHPGLGAALAELAERLACPLLVEPLSNLRFGPHDRRRQLVRYNDWLSKQPIDLASVRWIFRIGAFPVTRALQRLLTDHQGMQILADPWPRWNDPAHRLTHLLRADPLDTVEALLREALAPAESDWSLPWRTLEAAPPDLPPDSYAALIEPFIAALPEGCPVFVGNSLAIRMLDTHAGHGPRTLSFFANRGVSGIDGNISSALGIAAERGRVVALIGDLTCQHDLGGLALARDRNAILVVVNNGGGGIFEHLPQAGLPEFRQGWLTPQQIDFQHAAATFGVSYSRACATTLGPTLRQAIETGGPHLIEVPIQP